MRNIISFLCAILIGLQVPVMASARPVPANDLSQHLLSYDHFMKLTPEQRFVYMNFLVSVVGVLEESQKPQWIKINKKSAKLDHHKNERRVFKSKARNDLYTFLNKAVMYLDLLPGAIAVKSLFKAGWNRYKQARALNSHVRRTSQARTGSRIEPDLDDTIAAARKAREAQRIARNKKNLNNGVNNNGKAVSQSNVSSGARATELDQKRIASENMVSRAQQKAASVESAARSEKAMNIALKNAPKYKKIGRIREAQRFASSAVDTAVTAVVKPAAYLASQGLKAKDAVVKTYKSTVDSGRQALANGKVLAENANVVRKQAVAAGKSYAQPKIKSGQAAVKAGTQKVKDGTKARAAALSANGKELVASVKSGAIKKMKVARDKFVKFMKNPLVTFLGGAAAYKWAEDAINDFDVIEDANAGDQGTEMLSDIKTQQINAQAEQRELAGVSHEEIKKLDHNPDNQELVTLINDRGQEYQVVIAKKKVGGTCLFAGHKSSYAKFGDKLHCQRPVDFFNDESVGCGKSASKGDQITCNNFGLKLEASDESIRKQLCVPYYPVKNLTDRCVKKLSKVFKRNLPTILDRQSYEEVIDSIRGVLSTSTKGQSIGQYCTDDTNLHQVEECNAIAGLLEEFENVDSKLVQKIKKYAQQQSPEDLNDQIPAFDPDGSQGIAE